MQEERPIINIAGEKVALFETLFAQEESNWWNG
jgi:hypothetical protein